MRHVALVRSDQTLEDRLASSTRPFSFSGRQRTWEHKRTYLTVFVPPDGQGAVIRWLGAIEVTRRTSDIDRNLEVFRHAEVSHPLPIGEVIERLGRQGERIPVADGPLTETMGPRLVDALLALRPELVRTIDDLMAPRHQPLSGEESERLAQEKDGVGVLLDIAFREGRDLTLGWTPVDDGVPFLRGFPGRVVGEHHLIQHDADQFEDWVRVRTAEVDWRIFAKGGKAIRILNANNGQVETDLGIDLVYFNVATSSFVLVQYKKMTPDAQGKLCYRGDGRLESQVARMKTVDNACGGAGGDFRLYPRPCFLKLCNPSALVPDDTALIPGLYLAREHFEQLWNDIELRGPNGGPQLGWDNVERRLSNTQFTDLVKGGWIGSRGTGTEVIVRSIIDRSLRSGRSVVAGIEPADTTANPDVQATGRPR